MKDSCSLKSLVILVSDFCRLERAEEFSLLRLSEIWNYVSSHYACRIVFFALRS